VDIVDSKLEFLRRVQAAVEHTDHRALVEEVQTGIAAFDQHTVASMLSNELPMLLGRRLTERLCLMMCTVLS